MKTRKKVWVAAAALILTLALAACGSSSGSSGNKSSASDKKEKADTNATIEMTDSGYSVKKDEDGTWYVYGGAVYENKSSQHAYQYPIVTLTAYNKAGDVLNTTDTTQGTVQPGEKQAAELQCDCTEKPAKVKITFDSGDEIGPDKDAPTSKDFKITRSKATKDSYGEQRFTGQVTNNSKKKMDDIKVTMILKKGKRIVYADFTYVENVKPGQTKPYSISDYDLPEFDSVDVYAYSEL